MPEHIRALVVVIALSSVVFFVAKPSIVQIVATPTFDRWQKLWLFTTMAWFLSGNIWVYMFLMAVFLIKLQRKGNHIFAAYLLLLFAAPSAYMPVPGFGVIDHIIMLDHYRLLSLTLLLPVALRLSRDKDVLKFGRSPIDWMVGGYLILTWMMGMLESSVTNAIRMVVLHIIDGLLPFYVASRSIKSIEDFRVVMSAILLGALMQSTIGTFEVLRYWKLYTASMYEYGFPMGQLYKVRGPFLRPGAAVQDSIVLGMVVAIGIGAMLYIKSCLVGKSRSILVWATLLVGLLSSLSRAPWLAGILVYIVFNIQDAKSLGKLAKGFVVFAVAMIVLSFFPFSKVFFDLLPFIGESEQGSIVYRMDWFSISAPLIERNFWFGDVNVLRSPELEVMRQGEGIIDLVNIFLSVLLHFGIVGLFFYAGMFLFALISVRRTERILRKDSLEFGALGRSIFAIVVSIAFVILTLSAISVVPIMIWSLLGLSVAYRALEFSCIKKRAASAVLTHPEGK